MIFKTILLAVISEIRCGLSSLKVKQVHLFENNFWDVDDGRIKPGEGYLYAFKFVDERKEYFSFSDFKVSNCFFLDCNTKSRYIELSEYLAEKILSSLNSAEKDKNFIRIQFLTTHLPVKGYFKFINYKEEKHYHETHMWAERLTNNNGVIHLKFDKNRSRIIYIKERFKQLVGERFYKFINRGCCKEAIIKLEKNKDFELRCFSSYAKCYKSFRVFLKNSQFFGLSERPRYEDDASKTIMNPTRFIKRIDSMIKKDLENFGGDEKKSMLGKFCLNFIYFFCKIKDVSNKKPARKTYKLLIEKCFADLKYKMQEKKIFFYIVGKYDVNYYFKELYNQASKAVKLYNEKYDMANFKDKNIFFQEICESFYDSLKKLNEKVIDELFKTNFFEEHVSKLLGKDVNFPDDVSIVESIIFDYLNMLTYLSDYYCISGESFFNTFNYPLIFNYNHKCKIVSWLKIQFDTEISDDFVKVEALNKKDEKVNFIKNIHFFFKRSTFHEIYCTLEVLIKLNIKKIKIETLHKKWSETIEVDKYLNNKKRGF